MCVPCIIIASGCGTGNNAATSFINANEQFAEAVRYMVDAGTLSEADGKLVEHHCGKYFDLATEINKMTAETLALTLAIAQRTSNPSSK